MYIDYSVECFPYGQGNLYSAFERDGVDNDTILHLYLVMFPTTHPVVQLDLQSMSTSC